VSKVSVTQVVGFTVQACLPRLYRDRQGSGLISMQYRAACGKNQVISSFIFKSNQIL